MDRVMLTMPADLLREVDDQARQRGGNRSRLVRQVLQEWLERQRQKEFEGLLAEGYQSMVQENATVVIESLPAQMNAAEGVWRWNE